MDHGKLTATRAMAGTLVAGIPAAAAETVCPVTDALGMVRIAKGAAIEIGDCWTYRGPTSTSAWIRGAEIAIATAGRPDRPTQQSPLQTAMRSSRLLAVRTLDQFDFAFQPSVKLEQIKSLHGLDFFDRAGARTRRKEGRRSRAAATVCRNDGPTVAGVAAGRPQASGCAPGFRSTWMVLPWESSMRKGRSDRRRSTRTVHAWVF